jgi:P27 family predicted phage terminase small subunit
MQNYLSERGKEIYKLIETHCQELGILKDIDSFELSMLANSLDLYAKAAQHCKENGISQVSKTGWSQISAEYAAMKQEYQSITKHSAKFGLNPYDRERILNLTKSQLIELPNLD